MAGKTYPWVLMPVSWSDSPEWTRGTHDGLPLLSYGCADRTKFATYRQLRAMGLRPNGSDPVAVLYVRHNASKKVSFASLYLIANAAPVRPMTPAKWTALAKANLARRICRSCGKDPLYVVPRSTRQCWACLELETTTDDAAPAAA